MKMNKNLLPTELNSLLENEKIGFAVLAKREQSIGVIAVRAFLGVVLMAFASSIIVTEYRASIDFFDSLSFVDYLVDSMISLPAIVFFLLGLGLAVSGITVSLKTGSYWVGTDTRLLKYRKGILKTYPWQQFSGKIEVDFHKGNIDFELLSGSMTNPKNGQRHFIPEKLSLIGIDDVVLVEKFSRARMEVVREG